MIYYNIFKTIFWTIYVSGQWMTDIQLHRELLSLVFFSNKLKLTILYNIIQQQKQKLHTMDVELVIIVYHFMILFKNYSLGSWRIFIITLVNILIDFLSLSVRPTSNDKIAQ